MARPSRHDQRLHPNIRAHIETNIIGAHEASTEADEFRLHVVVQDLEVPVLNGRAINAEALAEKGQVLERKAHPNVTADNAEAGLAAPTPRGEFLEELVGHLLGGTVDQALSKLRELSADLCVHIIGQQRAAVL